MDYKNSLFLPETDFPMRGNLKQLEPEILEQWDAQSLYQKIQKQRAGGKKFVLHWGPPFANGHLHVGHAFNAILKDIVCRSYSLLGYQAPLVPGWDCHGLPIEWKIEEEIRAQGKRKEDVSIQEFRQACRDFAARWIEVQKDEFKRMGVLADLANPYVTMDYANEAAIVGEIFTFLEAGLLYQGARPIMWSVVEKTALAEAEIEYMDKTSSSIYVAFPIQKTSVPELAGSSVVIWTTTPWTLPGNRAVCYGPEVPYGLMQLSDGRRILLAEPLREAFEKTTGLMIQQQVASFSGKALEGTVCAHPLAGQGYDFPVPLLPGDHVTTDAGTGFVHTAPGHGLEDFAIGQQFKLEVPATVGPDGSYYEQVPLFAGLHIFKADPVVIQHVQQAGHLLWEGKLVHSYPHSWRSKKPLIFRTTPQWFIQMDGVLREKALKAIQDVSWFPRQSQNRIQSMVAERPDWCISRQRYWGVPIPVFVHKKTGALLNDPNVHRRIRDAIAQHGCDIWFTGDVTTFLEPDYVAADYEPIRDIVDVWFESGSTQGFVLEQRPDLQRPADLYLEGSDQHRGWFQSSLLVGCGTRGNAPFKNVLTHGFTVDEQGRKMSKSLGNTVDLHQAIQDYGAEILRLWVVSCDYTDDLRLGKNLLTTQQEIYRRYRNTLRYLLGAVGKDPVPQVSYDALPLLEKWVLHRLHHLNQAFRKATTDFNFQSFYVQLHAFCASDLSAFYLDIRKDCLYCDAVDNPKRQAAVMVMDYVLKALLQFLAPVLCFTAEEAWQHYGASQGQDSVHCQVLAEAPAAWHNPETAEQVEKAREQRAVMTHVLEQARAAGVIRSSLQAKLVVFDPQGSLVAGMDFDELAIVSQLEIRTEKPPAEIVHPDWPTLGCQVESAPGAKCERCWKVLPDVGAEADHPTLCQRCATVVKQQERAIA